MIEIKDKAKCCGCSACYSICPQKCINMIADEEGFLYPVVDKEKCTNCKLCEKACPINSLAHHEEDTVAYAVQHKDAETLYHSAAGGAYSAIASLTINKNGHAYGAAYGERFKVVHEEATTLEDLKKFRSSKYVQSEPRDNFQKVKKQLDAGEYVCYSGTPCQIAGLKKYLGREYNNLVTVDLVCKGVASPEVLRQYVELMEEKYGSRIVGMNFKRKTYGYHSSTMSVDFENGKTYSKGGITDPMMHSFRSNVCLRPSCGECPFKGVSRVSDLTIFDCWHFSELVDMKDDDKGHTAVLVHTPKGKEVLEHCKDILTMIPIDVERVVRLDGIMVNTCVKVSDKREAYMDDLRKKGLLVAIKKNIPVSIFRIMAEESKKILYKLGLLDFAKKIYKKL